jgi:copper chaperone NosL
MVLLLALVACREPLDQPVDPVWGKQPCDHCAMILSDARFAAESVSADGGRRYFDDIGCMIAYLREHPEAGTRTWVRVGERWSPASSAFYRTGVRTPMDYGVAADATGIGWSEAQALVIRKLEGGNDGR